MFIIDLCKNFGVQVRYPRIEPFDCMTFKGCKGTISKNISVMLYSAIQCILILVYFLHSGEYMIINVSVFPRNPGNGQIFRAGSLNQWLLPLPVLPIKHGSLKVKWRWWAGKNRETIEAHWHSKWLLPPSRWVIPAHHCRSF